MARSRSRSRDRSRRKHSSSDESDYDRRKRDSKKKRRRSRSRSRSTDSDRRRYKSSSNRYKSSGRSSSQSRSSSRAERRGDKSQHDRRDRSKSRSPSERKRRNRSRSRSPEERRRREKEEKKKDAYVKRGTKPDVSNGESGEKEVKVSLKERVAKLTETSSQNALATASATTFEIDKEKIAEIEEQGFRQQSFVSNTIKKESTKQNYDAQSDKLLPQDDNHENAIFGSSTSTYTKAPVQTVFLTNGSTYNKTEDELFGPSLLVDQSLRTKRWLQKLAFIRQKIVRETGS